MLKEKQMLQFVDFLEEIEVNNRTAVIAGPEVDRLVRRFGDKVRNIGAWNHAGDGSLEIPLRNITEAAQLLDGGQLSEAVAQLRSPERLAGFLNQSSAAERLIEELAKLNLAQFEHKVRLYQGCTDPSEADRLRQEISAQLFGA